MEGTSLGPFCTEIRLSEEHLNELTSIKSLGNCHVKIGVLLELNTFLKSAAKVIDVAKCLQPKLSVFSDATLRTKLTRLLEVKKKLVSKKKVKGFCSVEDLQQQPFELQSKTLFATEFVAEMKLEERPIQDTDLCSQQSVQADNCSVNNDHDGTSHSTDMDNFEKAQKKTLNVYDYELNKKNKTLNKLMNEIENSKNDLKSLENKVGHFGVRNVNKRDEKARITRQALRKSKAHVRGLTKIIEKLQNVKEENKQLAVEKEILKKELDMLNEKKLIIDSAENKKLNAQKSASYYKMKAKKLHQQIKSGESPNIDKVKHILVGKNQELHNLQVQVEMLTEELNEKHCTKNLDGSYTDNVRLCVIELAALEVATEKISPAIEVVSRHIFRREIGKSDLPNSTSVQTIVNEGHYLAKAFIAAKLDTVGSWGLNRDGTTRKKKKIVDTSITLESGDVISLGFTRVAHENARTIHDVTKKHITELAQLKSETSSSEEQMKNTVSEYVPIPQHTPIRNDMCQLQTPSRTINTSVSNDFITDSLSKLAFTMCDRASNEKLADKLWTNGEMKFLTSVMMTKNNLYCTSTVWPMFFWASINMPVST
ncbi:hypothetical protein ACJMK2_019722 [Sinanodonta woodiana]|uniref:Uncharacterized protein n=1 Tax=Sinanodonta woodiana TaxID=1069815 RepID=A0ABD3TXW4_SINWO